MTRRLILVRHGEIAARWRNVCYGWTDVELSELGLLQSQEVAATLAGQPITAVWHSGVTRTRVLAELIAARTGAPCTEEPSLRELNFGDWEKCSWDDIYRETGAAMESLILSPDTFRPPGGETAHELRERVLGWHRTLPDSGLFVAVAHGGTIAALLGTLNGAPASAWPRFIPDMGSCVEVVT